MTYAQLAYQSGFGSHLQSEAVPNALPKGQNSPKHAPHGLYAEQMNGSAFTRPRHQNLRSWLYRILPSVAHGDFQETKHHGFMQPQSQVALPNQLRWSALPHPKGAIDFVQSWQTLAFNGGPLNHQGGAIYLYGANTSMKDTYFYNADAEMLMVPYEGEMLIKTEFGWLTLTPGEIASLPRGVKFQVEVTQGPIMGYLLENYGQKLTLPDLGPIGANGLANPRDFQTPVARF